MEQKERRSVKLDVKVTPSMAEKIDMLASTKAMNRSEYVRTVLAEHLEEMFDSEDAA